MALLELLKQRRSVRDFLDKPVEREKIKLCLEAARVAPSACNSQPWKFIVVDDGELKKRLCDKAFSGIYAINAFCKKAPVIVVIVSERSKFLARIGGMFRGTKYYLIDIGIAGEHFVLQAQELGLGTCWIGWFNERAVKSVLNIPKDKKIDVLLALGYYDQEKVKSGHSREPLDKISSFNSY
ncbi:MAG TPA: NAD(P)H nitroreductase [Dehalococcoidia bacterium]|jgi:nitroreductase|nr:NAD(P)H nitroreductase [Dehalococcoidia bacterium]